MYLRIIGKYEKCYIKENNNVKPEQDFEATT